LTSAYCLLTFYLLIIS